MTNQAHLFELEAGVTYLNGAAYAPMLKSAVAKGMDGMMMKAARPFTINPQVHFEPAERVQKQFARLLNIDNPQRVAIITAASYGMAVVARNLHRLPGISTKKHILLIQDEFPNNVYAFERASQELSLQYKTVARPDEAANRGQLWNENILNSINHETAMIVIPHIHWIYGVRFDLAAVAERCKEVGALLIVDATQSVGAMAFDVKTIQPDAVICAGYKWLLGPYSVGLAYFGEFFDDGVPVEESWLNRADSDKFAQLINYQKAYRPFAQRYNAGEYSQFIQLPMLEESLNQILAWGVDNIQQYCKSITQKPLEALIGMGCSMEAEGYRGHHLLGLSLPAGVDNASFTEKLLQNKIIISNRGVAVRVSPNVYNTEDDMWALVECLNP
ncbi:aminotransferase class V-fold PLP-dependent enzyme [Emticicia sp. 21SJ11W-3]|uniref:aminotransferase class V-fold PLP-dependent enzyme n=1 Tax=Emticicia sp. 21SJ11W-3 TaxID=2916755 RepID=UPI00209F35BA|nr:aminotransferase class V-fold PLP-dependent enzyme [Emticicia sp. 21SJ11W-3]UTA67045.1 aminotransferase class V-fold PLP-dependent enzyme [Emticicia sp. 21SJ11W-3]